jgi:hypothetical protein
MQGSTPVLVLNTNTKRESGRKAQFANIQAAKVHPFRVCCWHTSVFKNIQNSGCRRNCHKHAGPPVHAQDAAGPHGRHRDDQRRVPFPLTQQRHPPRNRCAAPRRQDSDRTGPRPGRGGGRRHHVSHHPDGRAHERRQALHRDEHPPHHSC